MHVAVVVRVYHGTVTASQRWAGQAGGTKHQICTVGKVVRGSVVERVERLTGCGADPRVGVICNLTRLPHLLLLFLCGQFSTSRQTVRIMHCRWRLLTSGDSAFSSNPVTPISCRLSVLAYLDLVDQQ
jgi:hypothetical protein